MKILNFCAIIPEKIDCHEEEFNICLLERDLVTPSKKENNEKQKNFLQYVKETEKLFSGYSYSQSINLKL